MSDLQVADATRDAFRSAVASAYPDEKSSNAASAGTLYRFVHATRRHDFTRLAVAAGIDRPIDRLPAVRRGETVCAARVFVSWNAESPPTRLGGFR
ncbi:hypothetical protein RW1_007_02330 [Rhodococcus wratislaviensis NBRC 100605]|uniref:Uncharacterized protein n=1 Tax=Rhodococcus wratislaviensis NBRC 100605 TaxID=1219028 RepID=X0PMA2_RHOWR|nr:hypothetical protein RW1_007_02330 [Rhodococcus wratislaviensis NBRC 100605]